MVTEVILTFTARRQALGADAAERRIWREERETMRWPASATALLLCDVWDHHWCPAAEARLATLLPRMAQVVTALRRRGVQVVHAPSETMAFYADTPARRRVLAAPAVAPPPDAPLESPPLPVATPHGGCDAASATISSPWTRQHSAIGIDDAVDVVSDNGRELYAYYRQRGIAHVLVMGVHTNMCVLNRTFAIKQLRRWGLDVALLRDLTDAMYDPADPPYVSHEEGTALVVSYIEKFWCPTVESGALMTDDM